MGAFNYETVAKFYAFDPQRNSPVLALRWLRHAVLALVAPELCQAVHPSDRGSLLQASARRLSGPCFAVPAIITGSDYRFVVTEQLAAVETAAAKLIEPEGCNTAPAILVAALELRARPDDALMLVAPSDHVSPDAGAFRAEVMAAVPAAEAGQIVTFGIRPDRTETRFGWLALPEAPADGFAPVPRPLKGFVEELDAATAVAMLSGGMHLWNTGIFLFSTGTILAAFEHYALSQRHRKKIKEPFGWAKTVCGMAQTVHRSLDEVRVQFTMTMTACNLARLQKLLAA